VGAPVPSGPLVGVVGCRRAPPRSYARRRGVTDATPRRARGAVQRIVFHLTGEADATSLLDSYSIELPHNSYSMRDIVYLSYTNTAVDELLNRLGLVRNYKHGMWGTLHGITLHLLIKHRKLSQQIVSNTFMKPGGPNWWKRKFASKMGLAYDPTGEKMNLPGNRFFSDYAKYINVYFPQYQDLGRVLDKLATDSEHGYYANDWIKFKISNKIIDFEDILLFGYRVELFPEGAVLVSDEFQDYSPLQWAIFKDWMVDRDHVVVAGDDDQVLFSFQGATPKFMLYEFPADATVVLKKSHRLPAKVLAYSKLFMETYVKHRYPKKFEPRGEVGNVIRFSQPITSIPNYAFALATKGKTVLILARTNKQVSEIEEMFMFRGVPFYRFKSKKVTIWEDFVDRIMLFVDLLKAGKPVPLNEAKFYLKFTALPEPKIPEVANLLANPEQRTVDVYTIGKDPVKYIQFSKVKDYFGSERMARMALRALRAALATKSYRTMGKIYIDTIHSAKGREGDVVFLIDSISNKIYDEIYEDPEAFEAEMRVWYVGMTRARHTLVIVPGKQEFVWPHLMRALSKLKMEVKHRRGKNGQKEV